MRTWMQRWTRSCCGRSRSSKRQRLPPRRLPLMLSSRKCGLRTVFLTLSSTSRVSLLTVCVCARNTLGCLQLTGCAPVADHRDIAADEIPAGQARHGTCQWQPPVRHTVQEGFAADKRPVADNNSGDSGSELRLDLEDDEDDDAAARESARKRAAAADASGRAAVERARKQLRVCLFGFDCSPHSYPC